jgi:hypothetical protein
MSENELTERLELIERMIEEGRRSIERWGWAYVLWGVGHLLGVVATFTLPPERVGLAWGVLMSACGITMGVVATRRGRAQQTTTQLSRALGAVWWTFGLMVLFLFVSPPTQTSWAGWYAVFCAAYGGAFFASGHIVRWTPLKLNGLGWWTAGLAMKFLDAQTVLIVFGAMALIGEIGFGLYAMAHERKVLAGGG